MEFLNITGMRDSTVRTAYLCFRSRRLILDELLDLSGKQGDTEGVEHWNMEILNLEAARKDFIEFFGIKD